MPNDSMGISQFGDALLRTGDLDPVYVAIYNSNIPEATRLRLAFCYWCFYHLGLAAQLAEIKQPAKFWHAFLTAVRNEGQNTDGSKPYPRGAERRHFRGANALASYSDLVAKYKTPEAAACGLIGTGPRQPLFKEPVTYGSVALSVQKHVGFGPWIAFKIADMAERVLDIPVDFSDCHLGIYKDPRQGAALAYHTRGEGPKEAGYLKPWEQPISDQELKEVVDFYVSHWRGKKAKALPDRKRLVNVQEIETIFCKWKSHCKGHYPVGKDTDEVGHGLIGWGDLAEQLNQGLNDTRDAVLAWRKANGT
jgi:hypothetical protein